MLALSIRQPFAELILRGIKRIEYRSQPTKKIGEKFWIYATLKLADFDSDDLVKVKAPIRSDNLTVTPAPWILELAHAMRLFGQPKDLPRGLIVGSAVVERVEAETFSNGTIYKWHLADVETLKVPMKPERQPQPVWFRPFDN